MKFHENPSSCSMRTDGRTADAWPDMTKLIFAFRNFANSPKNSDLTSERTQSPLWKVIIVVWGQ